MKRRPYHWTAKELSLLTENYRLLSAPELVEQVREKFGWKRSEAAIYSKARALSLCQARPIAGPTRARMMARR